MKPLTTKQRIQEIGPKHDKALYTLFDRMTRHPSHKHISQEDYKKFLLEAFDNDKPFYGDLRDLGTAEFAVIWETARQSGIKISPLALKRLQSIIALVTPTTLVCDECGNFPIDNAAGVFVEVYAGECPICGLDLPNAKPGPNEFYAWTTGKITHNSFLWDEHTFPGHKVPLTTAGILSQDCELTFCSGLSNALRDAKLPYIDFLYFLTQSPRMKEVITTFDLLKEALEIPFNFDILTRADLDAWVSEAFEFTKHLRPNSSD